MAGLVSGYILIEDKPPMSDKTYTMPKPIGDMTEAEMVGLKTAIHAVALIRSSANTLLGSMTPDNAIQIAHKYAVHNYGQGEPFDSEEMLRIAELIEFFID